MKLKFKARKGHRNGRLTATDRTDGRTLYQVDGPSGGERPRYRITGVADPRDSSVRTLAEAKCVIREDYADRRRRQRRTDPARMLTAATANTGRHWSFSDVDG